VQLADALELASTRTLSLISGTFDAVSYNVTTGKFGGAGSGVYALRMGSGTWTLSGTAFIFSINSSSGVLYKGTADILLSDTSTNTRTISGLAQSFNKLTIGGATGISTLTISGNHQFTELASTKTVAHTIALGTSTQTFGKWSVTGTAGNVVTLTGTGTSHILAGACTSGIDYLAIGSIRFAATSPAEFYAGANSTATGSPAAPTYLTDKPADSTRYWVGGTGNWNDTNRWSTSSGGAGGADLPRSHDDVVFDSNSNATAYTATVNAITGGNRCKALTIAGPASGNVTLAGSTALFIHDDITLPATGLTRTYTGAITLSGTGAGKTITTNGVALANNITVNGVGAEWALADALDMGIRTLNVTNGAFDTANYNLTCGFISSSNSNTRALDFGSSTISIVGTFTFGTTENARAALTFSAGTSQLNINDFVGLSGNNQTFYNVSYTNTGSGTYTINGSNTFNNLTVAGRTSVGIGALSLSADQTINGTLTLSAGTNATARTFVRSDTIGTTRTLTCAAVASLTDIDFRDITIAGAAASWWQSDWHSVG
jgi:trimeric autotransporter adhesin